MTAYRGTEFVSWPVQASDTRFVRVISWIDDKHLAIGETEFILEPLARMPTRVGSFVLRKTRWMAEQYVALLAEPGLANVFELGIDQGGSTAFFALLLHLRKLVAIDIEPKPNEELTEFMAAGGVGRYISPHYGVDQADRRRLDEIFQLEFGNELLDLVVDDASHYALETTISFNALFPRLRPGGVYVIEDWKWDHTYERAFRADPTLLYLENTDVERPVGPTRLVLELALAAGSSPDVVAELAIRRGIVVVRKGPAQIDPEAFDISTCYGEVGRRVLS
jgi:hypothetical protein